MTRSSEERKRLRKLVGNAENSEERLEAILQLATLDRERNAETYDKLANE